jgi:hypothetical protein
MAATAAEYHALVKKYFDEKEDYVPRIIDAACEEAADLEEAIKIVEERERVTMERYAKESRARVEAVWNDYQTVLDQRDAVLKIAGVPYLFKPQAEAQHEGPPPQPEATPELQDAGSEGSADEKGRWIQKGTTYKISSFLSTRVAEITAGTRTSPVVSITWKTGKFSPNHPHMNSVVAFWQAQGPMNAQTARTRWASAGGAWERGGLRGVMRELIKQQILVPV